MVKYKHYLKLVLGIIITSLGFNMFLLPNNLAATDISGISIIFKRLYGINISLFVLIVNIALIILAYFTLGKEKTYKTILGSILLPLFLYLTEPLSRIINLNDLDMIIIAALGGILIGLGYGLVFKSGYNSGGTCIIEEILSKYLKVTIGHSMLFVDGFVVLAGGLAFGIESMLYSALALVLISIYSNNKIIGINDDKLFLLTTKKKRETISYLKNNYHYGITIIDAEGGYTNSEQDVIMCSISTLNYYRIKNDLLDIDPNLFMIIINSYDTNYINKDARKNRK